MKRIAIIAALPRELQPLVRGWDRQSEGGVELWRRRRAEREWIAACAGPGRIAAARAFAAIESGGALDRAVSAGFAGALQPAFETGRAYTLAGVIDAQTGEKFAAAGSGAGWLVTARGVADTAEKRRLAATFGAVLVDMEAASIAQLAAERGLPFHCCKGVSDGPSDSLPDFNRFMSAAGKWRQNRFICYALVRPWLWPVLGRLGRNSQRAAKALAMAVAEVAGDPNQDHS